MANAFCPPAMRNSLAHQRRLGWPTNVRSMARFFWINGLGQYPVPRDAYYMASAGDQITMIVPSHDLVVVRLGHYKGEATGAAAFQKALALLIAAVPRRN